METDMTGWRTTAVQEMMARRIEAMVFMMNIMEEAATRKEIEIMITETEG